MIISLKWLKELINTKLSKDDLVEKLTDLGLECSDSSVGPSFSSVVIGKVKSVEKHNNSDHLSFSSINKEFNEDKITKKINSLYKNKIGLNKVKVNDVEILDKTVKDLNLEKNKKKKDNFSLSKNVIDEILSLNENE